MGKTISNILNKLINVLIIVVLLYIFTVLLFPEKAAQITGFKTYTILTDSMTPVIPPGSLVLSKTIKADTKLKPGDIVTFEGDRFGKILTFTHYLKKVETDETGQERYYTQGYTASEYDPFTTYRQNLKGVYIWHVPYLGKVIKFLKSPIGLAEIALICILLMNQYFLGGYFDAQDRLILNIDCCRRLRLCGVKVKVQKNTLKLAGVIYNPSKDENIESCRMQIELLGGKKQIIDVEMVNLPEIHSCEKIPWECTSEQGQLIEDYRITLLPLNEKKQEETQ